MHVAFGGVCPGFVLQFCRRGHHRARNSERLLTYTLLFQSGVLIFKLVEDFQLFSEEAIFMDFYILQSIKMKSMKFSKARGRFILPGSLCFSTLAVQNKVALLQLFRPNDLIQPLKFLLQLILHDMA